MFGEVVSLKEGIEVFSQLVMVFVMVGSHGCHLEGAIHPFHLSISPRVIWFGETMLNVVLGTHQFEGVRPEGYSSLKGISDVWSR